MHLEIGKVYRDADGKQWRIAEEWGEFMFLAWDHGWGENRLFSRNGAGSASSFPYPNPRRSNAALIMFVGNDFEEEISLTEDFLKIGNVYKSRSKEEFKIIKTFLNLHDNKMLFLGVNSNARKNYSFYSTGRRFKFANDESDLIELVGQNFSIKKISLLKQLFNFLMRR